MTLLVRDEADIIAPMLEYHLASGVDHILVTDNGSVDGTREILAAYEVRAPITVVDDPVQDKNQSAKVTLMARRAATDFRADWVINADADEFFVPRNRGLTLADVFRSMPADIASATIPVVDMTGRPAPDGLGMARLVYRDLRALDTLFDRAGLHAHATHDAIHVGDPDVVVAQGNHYVSLASRGDIPDGLEVESIHFPWRSFRQFESKVGNAGRAYVSNPGVQPSPRHHGMRDFRFLQAGVLEESYIYRHPTTEDLGGDDLPEDTWLLDRLNEIRVSGAAVNPDLLTAAMVLSDVEYPSSTIAYAQQIMPAVLAIESDRTEQAQLARQHEERIAHLEGELSARDEDQAALEHELEVRQEEVRRARQELKRIRGRAYYRLASAASRALRAFVVRLRGLRRSP